MLRDRDSLRPAVVAPAAHAGAHRAQVRPRLRPLHHAPEHPVQLAAARGRAGHPGASWPRCEMHAIQTSGNCIRNITSRPLRRRRGRRDRRSAPVLRDHPPVVDVPSRVRLPAAQVQDRRQRARRPTARRCWCTTSACTLVRERRGRGRLPRARRRRPGPHADHRPRDPRVPAARRTCSPTSTRSCASTTATAAATTSTRRASRSWSRSCTPEEFRAEVEAEWATSARRPGDGARRGVRAARRVLRAAAVRDACPATMPRYRAALADNRAFASWVEAQRAPAQGAGLRGRHAVAQEDRRAAGRRDVRPDGRRRRPRRPLQLRRAARLARAEPDLRRRAAGRPARAVERAARRSASRRRTSACSPTSSAARAATSARSPTRSRSRSPRRSSAASTTSTTCTTSASSTSTSPAA